jgi:hypothetical protein
MGLLGATKRVMLSLALRLVALDVEPLGVAPSTGAAEAIVKDRELCI